MVKAECKTCGKEIDTERCWKLSGRDVEDVVLFCTDGCRMMFPFKKEGE